MSCVAWDGPGSAGAGVGREGAKGGVRGGVGACVLPATGGGWLFSGSPARSCTLDMGPVCLDFALLWRDFQIGAWSLSGPLPLITRMYRLVGGYLPLRQQ